jgi:hypothetical protein
MASSTVEYVPLWENYVHHDQQDRNCCCQECLDHKMVLWPNGTTTLLLDGMEVRLACMTEFEKHFLGLDPLPLPPPTGDPEEIKRVLTAVVELAGASMGNNYLAELIEEEQDEPMWPLLFPAFNLDFPVPFSSIMPGLRQAAAAVHPGEDWEASRDDDDNITFALLTVARGYFERKLSYL